MRIRTTVVAFFVFSLLLASSAMAQQAHVVDTGGLHHAVVERLATDQQNRDTLVGVLHRSDVIDVAGRLGLSVTRAENAVATLDSAELANLAGQIRTADVNLAGGSNTIIISTTTLLLIVIIVILLAN